MLDLLSAMNANGLTLVLVTHNPEVAQRADRVIVMADGRIARRLRADELRDPLPS